MYLSNEQIIAHQQRIKSIHFVMMLKLYKSLHGSWKKENVVWNMTSTAAHGVSILLKEA